MGNYYPDSICMYESELGPCHNTYKRDKRYRRDIQTHKSK